MSNNTAKLSGLKKKNVLLYFPQKKRASFDVEKLITLIDGSKKATERRK